MNGLRGRRSFVSLPSTSAARTRRTRSVRCHPVAGVETRISACHVNPTSATRTTMAPAVSAPKFFSDAPDFEYLCPQCGVGFLVPNQETFKSAEPAYSRSGRSHDAWDPDWITYRFTVTCVCTKKDCGEIAFVSGTGSVDQRYGDDGQPEYYDLFSIESFFPAPRLCHIPPEAPVQVQKFLKKSFSLYWVDTAAAANALRASLEALLDEIKIPSHKKNAKGETVYIALHNRLEAWLASDKDHAELCFALKEIGNLGSHGDSVKTEHYFGSLEIYSHVLKDLFEDNASKMKDLAQSIRDEIKAKKS